MLKKSLLSLAVTASLVGLAGCNISSTTDSAGEKPELQVQQEAALAAYGTYAVFDAVNKKLPFGIDLIFADAGDSDGTANVGADGGNSVFNAINDLDGISTLAPIDIALSGSIDPSSIVKGTNVILVKVPNKADVAGLAFPDKVGTDGTGYNIADEGEAFVALTADNYEALDLTHFGAMIDADNYETPGMANLGANIQALIDLQTSSLNGEYDVSVVSLDGGTNNTIRISPTKPLDAKSKYIAIVTNGVTTPDGDALKPSPDYAVVKAATADGEETDGATKLASSALVDVSKAINGWEGVAAAATAASAATVLGGGAGFNPSTVVISAAFTTTDPAAVLGAMIAPATYLPSALNPGNAVSAGIEPQARDFEFIPVTGNQISIKTLTFDSDTSTSSIPLDVNISQGAIKLPQYTDALSLASLNDHWEPLVTAATPEDTDGTTNVTYRFPFAAEKSEAVVPVLMFEPIGSGTSAACTGGKPWPVIIMQHGFTSSRTGNLINGSQVANFTCHAVIAMDLPHHGIAANAGTQLAFNVEQANGASTPWATAVDAVIAANADTPENTMLDELKERHGNIYLDATSGSPMPMDFANVAGDSGSLFIRLDNFQRTRDNLRQAVMDLANLNASLGNIDIDGDGTATGDLDLTKVKYIGHSLGAIVGTPFVALNNASLAGNTNLKQIQSAVLATPGGHLTKLIENSAALSGQVLAGLEGANEDLVQGNSLLESFMKVFQATLDSADPMNFAAALKSVNAGLGTPILLTGMYGGAALADSFYPSDLVVPVTGEGTVLASGAPKAPTAVNPLVGLNPMLEILGAENVTGTPAGTIYVAKYNTGGHGTFSSAGSGEAGSPDFDSSAAYDEMKAQTIDLMDDGALDANKAAAVLIAD